MIITSVPKNVSVSANYYDMCTANFVNNLTIFTRNSFRLSDYLQGQVDNFKFSIKYSYYGPLDYETVGLGMRITDYTVSRPRNLQELSLCQAHH